MIRNIISIIVLCAVGLAVWRIWGANGDLGGLLNSIWTIFYTVIDAVATAAVTAYHTVFG